MSLITFAYLIGGLVLLVVGAEALVRGAARLASRFGIPPLIIGLTVVAFGTSAPETAVSVQASLGGSGDIAVGNVIGSNIANILLILGLSALIAPLVVSRQLIRLDVPVMIGAGLLCYALAWNGSISRLDGALLLISLIGYTLFLVAASKREKAPAGDDEFATEFGPDESDKPFAWVFQLLLILLGLGLLVGGSNLLIEGAVGLARALGLSELVIGLTVVAVGTSMPELATSVLAVIKGERDIAVGNVVGSCIFNLLLVLGAGAAVAPGIAQRFDGNVLEMKSVPELLWENGFQALMTANGMEFNVNGDVSLTAFKRYWHNRTGDSPKIDGNAKTVGGWVLELFGKIPETNESVTTDDFRITVLKVSERRIVKVRLTVIPKSENRYASIALNFKMQFQNFSHACRRQAGGIAK